MRQTIHSTAFLGTLAVSAAMLLAGHSHAAASTSTQASTPSAQAIAACVGQKEGAEVKITLKNGQPGDGICVMRGTTLVAIPKPPIGSGP